MINKKFFAKLKKDYSQGEGERRQIGAAANNILYDSKRIIFSLHRGDLSSISAKFKELEAKLKDLNKRFGVKRLEKEGSYIAALEEYAEARLLSAYLQKEKIDFFKGLDLPHGAYLGGLCDFTGELLRYATNEAAKKNFKTVFTVQELINEILGYLVEFDLTGYMRTKYDQARTNLRKIEQMAYEISLRK
jgi:predicted translin family RNA/ssDNA-binding protein